MIMLTLVLLSGIVSMVFRLKQSSSSKYGRSRWLWMMAAKFLILIFLSPVSELIALKTTGASGQTELNNRQIYTVRSFKFALVVLAFLLGSYSKIFREDITNDFSREKRPPASVEGVNEQLL